MIGSIFPIAEPLAHYAHNPLLADWGASEALFGHPVTGRKMRA
jgi:hypothetical protein